MINRLRNSRGLICCGGSVERSWEESECSSLNLERLKCTKLAKKLNTYAQLSPMEDFESGSESEEVSEREGGYEERKTVDS